MPTAAGASGEDMGGMDMRGMTMPPMDMNSRSSSQGPSIDTESVISSGAPPWGFADGAIVFAMWSVMMVGMMTPSVAPMALLYAVVGRKARADRQPFAATGWFFAGYLLVWVGFSVAATGGQWLLGYLALLSPMMMTQSRFLGAVLLVLAGVYQWTPIKEVCLRQCQAPITFLASHGGFRPDPVGALRLGLLHGSYCLGCCWALMAILFVGGVMNIFWIAGIAVLVLLEKTLPLGRWLSRVSGGLLVAAGALLLVGVL